MHTMTRMHKDELELKWGARENGKSRREYAFSGTTHEITDSEWLKHKEFTILYYNVWIFLRINGSLRSERVYLHYYDIISVE